MEREEDEEECAKGRVVAVKDGVWTEVPKRFSMVKKVKWPGQSGGRSATPSWERQVWPRRRR